MHAYSSFENAIGIIFNDPQMLIQAFTHVSFANEHPDAQNLHNERLEFLGDAVLELIVTRYLYDEFPELPEGKLTEYRAALVRRETLTETARELGFQRYVLLSKGLENMPSKALEHILADTFEALIGAVYLDQGYQIAQDFVSTFLIRKLPTLIASTQIVDAKSLIQQKIQALGHPHPTYRVLHAIGPDHKKMFTVGIYFEEGLIAKGEGSSKREAEQAAARMALEEMGWNED